MEQLIELLQQIMDLAGAGIEALQGAAADAEGKGGQQPAEGGAPSEGSPEGGSGAPSEEKPPRY